jgi:hypothetical protein
MPNEFDPKSERHYPLLIIKAVEPGCTTELQIEDAVTGEVTRLTTTEDAADDDMTFERAVLTAFAKGWQRYAEQDHP